MANYKRPVPHQSGAATGYALEKYKHIYLPLQAQGWYAIANASDQADIAQEDAIITGGSGSPSFGEVTDAAVTGLHIDAEGDEVRLFWPIPYDCDVEHEIEFRVHWSSESTTTTDELEWRVKYAELTPDTTAIDPSMTALSTAIATDTNVSAKDGYQRTAWGKLNGGTLTNENVVILGVDCTDADMTLSSEATYAYFLEIRYVRRAL